VFPAQFELEPFVGERDRFPIDSAYVELFWLPQVGPTSLILQRRLLQTMPQAADVALLAGSLGVSTNVVHKTLVRLYRFGWLRMGAEGGWRIGVRTALPVIATRMEARLPPLLQAAHTSVLAEDLPTVVQPATMI
jgi:hypothetical protein